MAGISTPKTPAVPLSSVLNLYQERATLYRRLLVLATLLCVVLTVAMAVVGTRPRLLPYVLEIDERGVVRTLEPLTALDQTDERVMRAELVRVLQLLREWTHAAEFLESRHRAAAFYLAPGVRNYVEYSLPAPKPGQVQRAIDNITVLRRDDHVFILTWDENVLRTGGSAATSTWEAVVKLGPPTPTTERSYLKNPLGLVITSLDWSLRSDNSGGF